MNTNICETALEMIAPLNAGQSDLNDYVRRCILNPLFDERMSGPLHETWMELKDRENYHAELLDAVVTIAYWVSAVRRGEENANQRLMSTIVSLPCRIASIIEPHTDTLATYCANSTGGFFDRIPGLGNINR